MANNSAINVPIPVPVTKGGTGLTSTTINRLLYSSSNNVIGEIATANSAMLRTNSSGVPAQSASMTDGQLMIGSTGATPAPATLTAGSNISITNGAGSITINRTGGGGNGAAAYVRSDTASNITQSFGVSGVSVTSGFTCTVTFTSSFSGATYVSTMDVEYTPSGAAATTRLYNSTQKSSASTYTTTCVKMSDFQGTAPNHFDLAFFGS